MWSVRDDRDESTAGSGTSGTTVGSDHLDFDPFADRVDQPHPRRTDDVLSSLDRDGRIQLAGIDQFFFPPDPQGWGRSYLRAGYRYRAEDTSGSEFDSRGYIALGTLGVALPEDSSFVLEGLYERRDFSTPSSFQPAAGDRDDSITQWRTAFNWAFSDALVFTAAYRFVHWNSNVAVYDYDRGIYEAFATYRY